MRERVNANRSTVRDWRDPPRPFGSRLRETPAASRSSGSFQSQAGNEEPLALCSSRGGRLLNEIWTWQQPHENRATVSGGGQRWSAPQLFRSSRDPRLPQRPPVPALAGDGRLAFGDRCPDTGRLGLPPRRALQVPTSRCATHRSGGRSGHFSVARSDHRRRFPTQTA